MAASLVLSAPGTALADQLVKRYDTQEAVPTSVEEGGVSYDLASTKTVEVGPETETQTRSFSTTRTVAVSAADYNGDPESYLPRTVGGSEDGYTGQATLSETNVETRYSIESQTITKRETYRDLTQEEVDAIPQSREYTVSVADYPGATGSVAFERVALDVQPSRVSEGRYYAQAIYQGTEQVANVEGYEIAGSYSGTLSKTVEVSPAREIVEAAYEPVEDPVEDGAREAGERAEGAMASVDEAPTTDAGTETEGSDISEDAPSLNPALVLGAALLTAALAVAGGTVVFLVLSRKRTRPASWFLPERGRVSCGPLAPSFGGGTRSTGSPKSQMSDEIEIDSLKSPTGEAAGFSTAQ